MSSANYAASLADIIVNRLRQPAVPSSADSGARLRPLPDGYLAGGAYAITIAHPYDGRLHRIIVEPAH